jgi:precorrin-6Y C5,15-methyltransferase (decarboxylating)
VAIEVAPAPGTPVLPLVPGLRDDAYDSDGQLTKREVRAVTLAALAPTPHAVLWDVGAGSGSVSIEWLRAEPTAEAYAIEARDDRADRIERNARALGVPDRLTVVRGTAPGALDEIPAPAVVFIGGGVTVPGVLERCWNALPPHGRIVANTVTLEGEQRLVAACAEHGGTLTRVEVSRAAPIGTFTGWRPQMPVVQWAATTGEPRP